MNTSLYWSKDLALAYNVFTTHQWVCHDVSSAAPFPVTRNGIWEAISTEERFGLVSSL